MPEGCYVSLFTVYDDVSDPKYDGVNSPGGLKVKLTNGSWGWDGKVEASRNIIAEALAEIAAMVSTAKHKASGIAEKLYGPDSGIIERILGTE
jgi:hypothetical protein